MARFRGTVQGARGEVSRLGTTTSGVMSSADGWNLGGTVEINEEEGSDVVEFTLTGGSNTRSNQRRFARFVEGTIPTLYPSVFVWKPVGPSDDPESMLRADFKFGTADMIAMAFGVDTDGARAASTVLAGMPLQTTYIKGLAYVVTMRPDARQETA